VRFRVEANSDGSLPVDKIAGLLAVHCLVRGQAPEDYEVMVITRDSLLHDVAEHARQLLVAGRAFGAGVKVSRREREVLSGILQSLTNKEIAAKLNVSERTVKFHVSSLLAKFGVGDRAALSREVALGRMPASGLAVQASPHTLFGYQVGGREGEGRKIHALDPSPPVAEVPQARACLPHASERAIRHVKSTCQPQTETHISEMNSWLLLAEGHLRRCLFGQMLRRIYELPVPAGSTPIAVAKSGAKEGGSE
jgi:DNA-binding CsgD family transcriptional regulator